MCCQFCHLSSAYAAIGMGENLAGYRLPRHLAAGAHHRGPCTGRQLAVAEVQHGRMLMQRTPEHETGRRIATDSL